MLSVFACNMCLVLLPEALQEVLSSLQDFTFILFDFHKAPVNLLLPSVFTRMAALPWRLSQLSKSVLHQALQDADEDTEQNRSQGRQQW